MHPLLIKFENSPSDIYEKIANYGLGLLRIGIGRTFHVTKASNGTPHFQTRNLHSLIVRISSLVLAFILFPVTIAGYIAYKFSKSHQVKSREYIKEQNKEYNSSVPLVWLPKDMKLEIIKYITDPNTIGNLSASSRQINREMYSYALIRAKKTRTCITQTISLATQLNTQVIKLTNYFCWLINVQENMGMSQSTLLHQFNLKKWMFINKKLENPIFVFSCPKHWRVDLIEALAEYNVKADNHLLSHIRPEEPLINWLTSKSIGQKVLNQAKRTHTGSIFASLVTEITLKNGSRRIGPFASIKYAEWSERANQLEGDLIEGTYIHINHLLGKRQGNRICLNQKHLRIILRCRSNSSQKFEQELVLNLQQCKNLPNYQSLMEKAIKAYPEIKFV